ncbi:L-aspartate oxidase [Alkalithermobacter thermoalcaliphilus JW-YL-7 = DSM 7308]|uniref:L-aspartate oxidase n=1 Tax=Alkalithermobacter thermoalcaliphilus JW-YL-7 = DSM 7308 TaxID=1121328 RepID=A0A150FT58_CLOPD|nr:L-aspartate oxidase [[Clostridium] paradoxum JW-YL-7 = DSM 7308]SHL28790.1 L-aspartate oxidase [[Clostridium] paradoxum JW-YL-7 = DSM 7308]
MQYDVIIVGSGVSGLYTSINLDSNLSVLVLSKSSLENNNSNLAQGGIAAALEEDEEQDHIKDTLIAGNYKNNIDNLKLMIKEAKKDIEKLISIGVEFDKDKQGNLLKTLEGGHSRKRIIHHKDATGKEVLSKLIQVATEAENIDIIENAFVYDACKINDSFIVSAIYEDNKVLKFRCRYLVLATGGLGKIYKYTTNSSIATGDGIAIAYLLGAKISNLNLIQFHPTALCEENEERFLISEAVRGEGAHLVDQNGYRFMELYDDRKELAPRDIVSLSILKEMKRKNYKCVYLDISHKDKDFIKERFPNIYKKCLDIGIDITNEKIPVTPVQHYLMGGIYVNKNGQTTINRLYAVGECSYTGVHGNNRLASNSLLECLVFSRLAARHISLRKRKCLNNIFKEDIFKEDKYCIGINKINFNYKKQIQDIMQRAYFIQLDVNSAIHGIGVIDNILNDLKELNYVKDIHFYEIRNMCIVSKLILQESIRNVK